MIEFNLPRGFLSFLSRFRLTRQGETRFIRGLSGRHTAIDVSETIVVPPEGAPRHVYLVRTWARALVAVRLGGWGSSQRYACSSEADCVLLHCSAVWPTASVPSREGGCSSSRPAPASYQPGLPFRTVTSLVLSSSPLRRRRTQLTTLESLGFGCILRKSESGNGGAGAGAGGAGGGGGDLTDALRLLDQARTHAHGYGRTGDADKGCRPVA